MANSSNISLRLNVENGDYMIVWGMYDVKHSGSEVSNCWLYLLITWGYLIYKTGWITAQKCDVSICRQYFGMSGVRPWAWPRDGILSSRHQAIIWTNAGIFQIRPLGTKFSEISIEIHVFSFTKNAFENVVWKMGAILSQYYIIAMC